MNEWHQIWRTARSSPFVRTALLIVATTVLEELGRREEF